MGDKILVSPCGAPGRHGWGVLWLTLILSIGSAARAQTITIDGTGAGRIFDGIGAVGSGGSSRLLIDYPEPQRSQILDFLFKPNYGASLQTLKVEVGGEENSGVGAEPTHMRSAVDQNFTRGYEWWLMEQAVARNPNITLQILPWGAPGWIGGGNYYSDDMIAYLINFINGARTNHGLTIATVGIWNEVAPNTTWIKNLKAALTAAGLSTKVAAADESSSAGTEWEIVDAMNGDAALKSAVDIVASHYACRGSTCQSYAPAIALGKPLWS